MAGGLQPSFGQAWTCHKTWLALPVHHQIRYYLNQCWPIAINFGHKETNFSEIQIWNIFSQENAFENISYKMPAIFFRSQYFYALQAAINWPNAVHVCGDNHPQAVPRAKENIEALCKKRLGRKQWVWRSHRSCRGKQIAQWSLGPMPQTIFPLYRQVSNIRRTESQHLKDSHTVLRLSLPNPLKPDVKSRMKM